MFAIGSFGQGGKQSPVDPHWHHLTGPVPHRLAPALTEPVNVIAPLGLIRPLFDVLLCDRLALDLLHT